MVLPASDSAAGSIIVVRPLSWSALLLSLLAGSATVFAFAPFGAWPVQLACLALLTHLFLNTARARDAFLLGWSFGAAALQIGRAHV